MQCRGIRRKGTAEAAMAEAAELACERQGAAGREVSANGPGAALPQNTVLRGR